MEHIYRRSMQAELEVLAKGAIVERRAAKGLNVEGGTRMR